MAIRTPSGITVNGVGVFIKDPAATDGLFTEYVRAPWGWQHHPAG